MINDISLTLISIRVSHTLKLPKSMAQMLWIEYERHNVDLLSISEIQNVLPVIDDINEIYASKREKGWFILQELFRIDQDEGHPYHSVVSKTTDFLVNKRYALVCFVLSF